MTNLLTAIMSKTIGSALSADVGGRIYFDLAPGGAAFPYVVFSVVSSTPERTFTEQYTNSLIQFSLLSASSSVAEIADMYADLNALFDECSLTITGSTLVWMKRQNLTTMADEITTPEGTGTVKHWAVDYEVLTSLN